MNEYGKCVSARAHLTQCEKDRTVRRGNIREEAHLKERAALVLEPITEEDEHEAAISTVEESDDVPGEDACHTAKFIDQAADNLNSALHSLCGDGAIELSTSLTRPTDDYVEENPPSDQESPGFAGDPVKYLGGTQWKETTLDEAKSALENLFAVARSALVSPTQAAHLLNDYAVPSLLAKLGASWDISSTNLRRIDELWRSKLKNLPKLPRNLSDGAFYVPLSKGGLGFRSLEQEVQCTRFNALRAVLDKFGSAIDLRKEIGSLTDHLKKLSDQHELSQ
ncbi:hypothetical protein ACOME3_004664 [Neoechinorhynchus agilis]